MRLHFGGRAGPNLRPHHAQQRFIVGVDGDEQMNEEAETCPVAAQPQLPPPVAPGKIDLGRVLRHDNAPAAASLRRASGGLLRDRLRGRPLRSEKAMGCDLPRAISAKLANHQRARSRDVLEDPLKSTRNANISAETPPINAPRKPMSVNRSSNHTPVENTHGERRSPQGGGDASGRSRVNSKATLRDPAGSNRAWGRRRSTPSWPLAKAQPKGRKATAWTAVFSRNGRAPACIWGKRISAPCRRGVRRPRARSRRDWRLEAQSPTMASSGAAPASASAIYGEARRGEQRRDRARCDDRQNLMRTPAVGEMSWVAGKPLARPP